MRLNMTSKILESVQSKNEDTKTKSYNVLREEAVIKEGLRTCPRCGHEIIGFPAVSRFDNETEICSDCGTDEALENLVGFITNPITHEKMSLEDFRKLKTSEDMAEEVTIDNNQEDKDEIEDKIGELRVAIDDGAMSEDEKEEIEKEISDLEGSLNEGAYLDNRAELVKCFNEAWSEAKFLQAEMRFAKPSIEKLRESIPVICDNLDKLGELLKLVDESEGGNQ